MPTLNWIGKDAVVNHHKEVPFRLLKPVDKLSVISKTSEVSETSEVSGTGNLLIQGDNLEALKALLPYYAGQVKCIYIDPPYNTGNEGWVYNDNVNSPEMKAWLGKVVGGETEDLSRHDKWLCMMYPRIVLLRNLLTEDGSFWINLDDNEAHRAKLMLDEIFGSINFVANVIWEKSDSPKMDSQYFSLRHDHLIMYARNIDRLKTNRLFEDNIAAHYNRVDENGRSYYLKPLRAMGGQGDSRAARPNLYFELTAPDGTRVIPKKSDGTDGAWRWSQEKVNAEKERIEWVNGRNGWSPYFRIYGDTGKGRPPETIWTHKEVGSNRTSKVEIKSLFPDEIAFDTPKPIRLIQRILQIATEPEDLVLDAFAGSGTTGHAVLKQNMEDEGDRRFILIEIDQDIARKITCERLKRVIIGYGKVKGLGTSFRYCELGATLFDANGQIREEVKYNDLAQHIYFIETGQPLPTRLPKSTRLRKSEPPLLGVYESTAVYLLYNGVLKDKKPNGGNVLTRAVLQSLPRHDGAKIIYGTGCLLSDGKLRELGITFRQIPYEVKSS
jgi:adenine-specific DNA-methyltransferase